MTIDEPTFMQDRKPRVPDTLSDFAREILTELGRRPESQSIIIGGGVALNHYLPARPTMDLDAWWRSGPVASTAAVLSDTVREVADRHDATVLERSFGDVVSYDMVDAAGRKIFSVQIATRDVELENSVPSPWGYVRIETLADNLGAKMSALVNRGAPRDFADIREAVVSRVATIGELWELWQKKNAGVALYEAKLQALHHLEGIERRAPLDSVLDPARRAELAMNRRWYRVELLSLPRIEPPQL